MRIEVKPHRTKLVKYLYPAVEDKGMERYKDTIVFYDLAVVVDLPVLLYIIGLQFSLVIRCSDPYRDHGAIVGDMTDDIKIFDSFAHDRIIARNSYLEIA